MKSQSDSYASAGVDITAGYKAVELMKSHIARTTTDGVIGSIGGFGGLFQPNLAGMEEPILVSGTDGVGTKLRIAFLMDKHDTVGIDCVAMCVNVPVRCSSWTISHAAKTIPTVLPLSFPALQRAVFSPALRLSEEKPQRCPDFTRWMNMILPVLQWASWTRKK